MRLPHLSAGHPTIPASPVWNDGPVSSPALPDRRKLTDRRIWLPLVVGLLALIAIAASTPAVPLLYFVVSTPHGKTGVEVFIALAQLFVALVLYLFSESSVRLRLAWLALGCVSLSVGGLLFSGLLPMLSVYEDRIDTAMFASILSHTFGIGCIALGLAPRVPPVLTRRRGELILGLNVALLLLVLAGERFLPNLSQWTDLAQLRETARTSRGILPGLTPWHWALSCIPILLATLAAFGVARHLPPYPLGNWLLLAMVLLGGAQVFNLLCPSAYSSILTLASFLRLASAGVLALGAVHALNRISAQRAAMLAYERELSARLTDLALLKADFSAMVAHELASPLAAIRRSTDLLAIDLPSPVRTYALDTIRTQIDMLDGLVADVQAAGTAERDDFTIKLRPVPLDMIIDEAAAFARALPGGHDFHVDHAAHHHVWADDRRIGQVLHNLLGNAAKFSPAGTSVTLRTRHLGSHVRIEVADAGPGIHPDDLQRVFDKFGRGRDAVGQHLPGVGLGLYLSRRIVRSHGADLTVTSELGHGTAFAFDLAVAR